MALIVNHGIGRHDIAYVWKMGGLMVVMSILGFGTTLRNTLFRHISTLSYTEIDRFGTPSLINRIINDVNQLQIAVAMLIRLVIRAPFICIGAIIMSMLLDFRLSLVLIAATPVFAIILYLINTCNNRYMIFECKFSSKNFLINIW